MLGPHLSIQEGPPEAAWQGGQRRRLCLSPQCPAAKGPPAVRDRVPKSVDWALTGFRRGVGVVGLMAEETLPCRTPFPSPRGFQRRLGQNANPPVPPRLST